MAVFFVPPRKAPWDAPRGLYGVTRKLNHCAFYGAVTLMRFHVARPSKKTWSARFFCMLVPPLIN